VKFSVKLKGEIPQAIQRFCEAHPQIDTLFSPVLLSDSFFVVKVLAEVNLVSLLTELREDPNVLAVNHGYLSVDSSERFIGDRLIVMFESAVPQTTIDSLRNLFSLVTVDSSLAFLKRYVYKTTPQTPLSVLELANLYALLPSVKYAQPDFWAEIILNYQPTDQYFDYQWNFYNSDGTCPGTDIDALGAWEFTLGDSTIKVAVLDEGIEAREDLPASRLVDGYDFAGDNSDTVPPAPPDSDPSPGDSCSFHGMACAGLIAATHNTIGVAGLVPNCKIMPIKIADNGGKKYKISCPTPRWGLLSDSQVGNALNWVWAHGGSVSSNSWSSGTCETEYSPDIAQAIRNSVNAGVIVVFSAGNTGRPDGTPGCVSFPGNMQEVIAVGATDYCDRPWYYTPSSVWART